MSKATFASGEATAPRASSRTTRPKRARAMVVLDAVHRIQAEQANDFGGALELQSRQMRLLLGRNQRHAATDVHDAASTSSI